jgi:hypothetical protein
VRTQATDPARAQGRLVVVGLSEGCGHDAGGDFDGAARIRSDLSLTTRGTVVPVQVVSCGIRMPLGQ